MTTVLPIRKKAKKAANQITMEEGAPKRYRINRNATIWSYAHDDRMTVTEISETMQLSKSTIRNVLADLKQVTEWGTIENYFKLAYDICDEIEKIGKDPDKYLCYIVNSLWFYEINSQAKFKKLTAKEFKELLASSRVQRYPNTAPLVLENYKKTLKTRK